MNTREWIARNLAMTLLSGPWTPRSRSSRASKLLGTLNRDKRNALLRRLTVSSEGFDFPPSPDWLTGFFLDAREFDAAIGHILKAPHTLHCALKPAAFAPADKFKALDLPRLNTTGDLAAWLGVTLEHLDWFADTRRQHGRTRVPVLQNYTYAFALKKLGGARLIEEPKPRLKTIQRRILRDILDHIPVHSCVHGFVAHRACVTSARIHCGEFAVVGADLKDYFPSVRPARIHGLFRAVGYPDTVAGLLTGLCTSVTPQAVFDRHGGHLFDWPARKLYQQPHLPQGAPSSPALANLVTFSFDRRISGLSRRFEANYTRYADDLAFSGDKGFESRIGVFLTCVEKIAEDEGFRLNPVKTRIKTRSQSQRVTGVVVNEHVNLPREAYDELKAILHNCRVQGPQSQNRAGIANFKEHLLGRVAWATSLNTRRGARLRTMFDLIQWNEPCPLKS